MGKKKKWEEKGRKEKHYATPPPERFVAGIERALRALVSKPRSGVRA
jgi:hypothetical protein